MSTAIHHAVEAARGGRNPSLIARMPSGWAVMGDPQVLRGYSLLLPDPVVPSLNSLDAAQRVAFLLDMVRLGDALLKSTGCARVNYEILGNLEPALHAHVVPRYADEPETHRTKPVWTYDWKARPPFDSARDDGLRQAIRAAIVSDAPTTTSR